MSNTSRRWLLGPVRSGVLVAVVLVTVLGCAVGNAGEQEIWVTNLDGMDHFTYEIENKRVVMTGAVNQFRIALGKREFFQQLRTSYPVFAEDEDRIQMIWKGEIYTVRQYGDGHYALYGECFMVMGDDGLYQPFPFPTDQMDEIAVTDPSWPVPYLSEREFSMKCDWSYLERFYEVYGPIVEVGSNTIQYRNCAIVIRDGGRVEVVGP